MVLTTCSQGFLPLDDTDRNTQAFYKNEHHHMNALHRQNASFNLLDTNHMNQCSNISVNDLKNITNGVTKNNMPILTSNACYYGYVNNFSAVGNEQGTHYNNQQVEHGTLDNNCTDSIMCVDEEVNNGTTLDAGINVDKRKRMDETYEEYYEPVKRRRFEMQIINGNSNEVNLPMMPPLHNNQFNNEQHQIHSQNFHQFQQQQQQQPQQHQQHDVYSTTHQNYIKTNENENENFYHRISNDNNKTNNGNSKSNMTDDLEQLFFKTHGSALFYQYLTDD